MVSKMNKTNMKALIGVLQKENQGLKEELELEKGGREHDVQQFQEVLSENQGLKTKIEELEETLRMKEKYETDQMSEVMGENMDLHQEIKELKAKIEELKCYLPTGDSSENKDLRAKVGELKEENKELNVKLENFSKNVCDQLTSKDEYSVVLMNEKMDLAKEIKELEAKVSILTTASQTIETENEELKAEKKKVEKDEQFYRFASIGADEVVQKLKKENADLLLAIGSKVVSGIFNKVEKEDEKWTASARATELENLMEYKNSYEEHQHMLAFIAGNYKNGTYVEAILCKYYNKEFIENNGETWNSFGLFTEVDHLIGFIGDETDAERAGGWKKFWEKNDDPLDTVPDERLVPIANGELTRLQDEVKELTTYKKEVTHSIQQAVARVLDLEGFY